MARERWNDAEVILLKESITVPNRADLPHPGYLTWKHVAEIMNERASTKKIDKRVYTEKTCCDMYSRTLLYTLGGAAFDPTTFGLQNFPWCTREFEQLRDLIPSSMIGGRSEDTVLDWKRIADIMAEKLHNPVEAKRNRKYTAATTERAYEVRVKTDFYASG